MLYECVGKRVTTKAKLYIPSITKKTQMHLVPFCSLIDWAVSYKKTAVLKYAKAHESQFLCQSINFTFTVILGIYNFGP